MRKPPRLLVLAVALPFAAGCFSPQPAPLPSPAERADVEIRGVVVGDPEDGGRSVEFEEIYDVQWGPSELSIQGMLDGDGASANVVTERYAYTDLSGVLTNQVDVNRTSFLVIGTVFTGIVAVIFFFTERTGGAGPAPPGG